MILSKNLSFKIQYYFKIWILNSLKFISSHYVTILLYQLAFCTHILYQLETRKFIIRAGQK